MKVFLEDLKKLAPEIGVLWILEGVNKFFRPDDETGLAAGPALSSSVTGVCDLTARARI